MFIYTTDRKLVKDVNVAGLVIFNLPLMDIDILVNEQTLRLNNYFRYPLWPRPLTLSYTHLSGIYHHMYNSKSGQTEYFIHGLSLPISSISAMLCSNICPGLSPIKSSAEFKSLNVSCLVQVKIVFLLVHWEQD